jgi:ferritin
MTERVDAAINDQLNLELSSAYAYLSMSAHFEASALPGFGRWMRLQAKEEVRHAMRFFDFLNDRGGRVALQPIAAPAAEFASPLAAFEQALEHERRVTGAIHALYDLAAKEGDHAIQPILLSFISEQVEEEKTARDIVDQLRMIGGGTAGILVLDHHLGKRES